MVGVAVGLLIGLERGWKERAVSLVLSLSGWEISRLWFYLMLGAMVFLIGVQLFVYWIFCASWLNSVSGIS